VIHGSGGLHILRVEGLRQPKITEFGGRSSHGDLLLIAAIRIILGMADAQENAANLQARLALDARTISRPGSRLVPDNAAVGAHLGGDIVRVALARTFIEVDANREIAVMREPTRRFNVELAPAREMMDKHYARKWARTRRLGHISGNCRL